MPRGTEATMRLGIIVPATALLLGVTGVKANTFVGSIPYHGTWNGICQPPMGPPYNWCPIQYFPTQGPNPPNSGPVGVAYVNRLFIDWNAYQEFVGVGQQLQTRLCIGFTETGSGSAGYQITYNVMDYFGTIVQYSVTFPSIATMSVMSQRCGPWVPSSQIVCSTSSPCVIGLVTNPVGAFNVLVHDARFELK